MREDIIPFSPTANRSFESNSYSAGKTAGHYTAIIFGLLEVGVGGTGDAGAALATVGSGGILTPVTAIVATGATVAIVHGANVMDNAVKNLSSEGDKSPPAGGRGSNHLKPDQTAQGDHSTFRTDPNTGKTTNTATYKPNSRNPSGFQETKRVDIEGGGHKSSKTGQNIPSPHVHEPKVKDPRPAKQNELPKQ